MTLIELMVTLVILALLVLGAGPSVTAWIRNSHTRNVASSLMAGLSVARNEAVRRNQQVRFSLVSLTDARVMDASCAVASSGLSWVVSMRDPTSHCDKAPVVLIDDTTYQAAVADSTDPLIVQKQAGGQGGGTAVVEGKVADGSATADTVVFDGYGRIVNATPIGFINVGNTGSSSDYRRLRVELTSGGSMRLCDRDMAVSTDGRYCASRAIP